MLVICWGTCISMPDCTFTFCICIYTSLPHLPLMAIKVQSSALHRHRHISRCDSRNNNNNEQSLHQWQQCKCVQYFPFNFSFFWYCPGILVTLLGNSKATDWLILVWVCLLPAIHLVTLRQCTYTVECLSANCFSSVYKSTLTASISDGWWLSSCSFYCYCKLTG